MDKARDLIEKGDLINWEVEFGCTFEDIFVVGIYKALCDVNVKVQLKRWKIETTDLDDFVYWLLSKSGLFERIDDPLTMREDESRLLVYYGDEYEKYSMKRDNA